MPRTRSTRTTSHVSPAATVPSTDSPADVVRLAPAKSSTTSDTGSKSVPVARNGDSSWGFSIVTAVSWASDEAGTVRITPPASSVRAWFPPSVPRTDSRPARIASDTVPCTSSVISNVRRERA
jgi:hypothetical protein